MGVFIRIKYCDCCGGDHDDLELFAPGIPGYIQVWRGMERDGTNCWYLCPDFRYAVPVNLAQLKK